MELLVLKAICKLVFLNILIRNVVSRAMYTKVVHFCLHFLRVRLSRGGWVCNCLTEGMGKELLHRILWMTLHSCYFTVQSRLHVFKQF
jgi:hypothetical protein